MTETYRAIVKIPSLAAGRIHRAEDPSVVSIESVWSQRDLSRNESVKLLRHHVVHLDPAKGSCRVLSRSAPTELVNEASRRYSQSDAFLAVVRKTAPAKRSGQAKPGETSDFLEVYSHPSGRKELSVSIKSQETHEKVLVGDYVGHPQWSNGEGHLMFLAERRRKAVPFFDPKFDPDAEPQAEEFLLRYTWGEQLQDFRSPEVCILDVASGNVTALENLPPNLTPTEATWSPDDDVLFVGLDSSDEEPRLGRVYCFNRRSRVYVYNLAKAEIQAAVGRPDAAVASPRFNPSKSKLAYLETDLAGPHMKSSRLMVTA